LSIERSQICLSAKRDRQDWLVRSDLFLEFFPGDFAVPENLGKESTADRFASVDGNNGASAVGMTEEMVTSLDSYQVKTEAAKRLDELNTAQCRKCAHAMTVTRWTPMN
jgi:hypothetical protein